MRCGVVARKLGMSRIFSDDGEHIPVTVLRIEDVEVLAIKSIDKDGYSAIQLGFSNGSGGTSGRAATLRWANNINASLQFSAEF